MEVEEERLQRLESNSCRLGRVVGRVQKQKQKGKRVWSTIYNTQYKYRTNPAVVVKSGKVTGGYSVQVGY